MPDVYASITDVDPAVVERVGEAMEISAADPQHRAMVAAYLDDLAAPAGARVLEIGCGTGAIARELAAREEIAEVVGIDPSPILLETARRLAAGTASLSFAEGDGRALPFAAPEFDAVVIHRVLSHVPGPEAVVAEAARVLRPGGRLVVFDGDYATITLATADVDPLQVCVDAFAPAYITDPWVVRRLASLLRDAGFAVDEQRSHGYVQTAGADYMVSIADRGADALLGEGRIGPGLAQALKDEARRRKADGTFFGQISYGSLTATKPS
jgi:ubiquinone/menaquinone biosynthesis C-methylase UbiE